MSVALSPIAQLSTAVELTAADCRGIDNCRLQGNWQLWIVGKNQGCRLQGCRLQENWQLWIAGELIAVDCRGFGSCGLRENYQLSIAGELTAVDYRGTISCRLQGNYQL